MSVDNNHIDELIEKSLEDAVVAPSDRFWQKANNTILSQMQVAEKRRARRWRKLAFLFAGMAVLFFGGNVYFFLEKSKPQKMVLVNQTKSLQDFDLQNERASMSPVAAVNQNEIPVRTKNKPEAIVAVSENTELVMTQAEPLIVGQDPQISESISPSFSNDLVVEEPLSIVGKGLHTLTANISRFDISSNELTQLTVSRKLSRPFAISVYGVLGESGMTLSDNRTTDAQFPSDVMVKNRTMRGYGLEASYRFTRKWGFSFGIEQLVTKTGINSHFFADTTGTGVISEPEEGEEEGEGEGEGEIGAGNTTVQSSTSGYDIVTNLGQVHLIQPKNIDCTLLSKSTQEISYLAFPVQLSYTIPIRSFTLAIKVGGVYHHLNSATARLYVNQGNELITMTSSIDGLKQSFFSSRLSANLGYSLNRHWALQIGCDWTKGLTNLNASTPFGTRMHTFAGRSALSYNF